MSLLDTLAGVPQPANNQPVNGSYGTVEIIPYNAVHDPQADAFLPWLWKRMQEDDLVDYYFPGQKETGFATFVRMMSGDANIGLVINRGVNTHQWEDTVAGFITWTDTHLGASQVAIAGFIFFRKFWDHHLTDEAARQSFRFWFTDTPATLVLGVCPALHRTAIIYNKRIGLREVGRLPLAHLYKGAACDAILFAMTREEWQKEKH